VRKGAAGEMLVIADLLHRGYEVWRAVSGQVACDLVVEIDGRLYKVEVRSVARQLDGPVNSPGGSLGYKGHHILAVVDRLTSSTHYFAADDTIQLELINALPFPEWTLNQALELLTAHLRRLDPLSIPVEQRASALEQISALAAELTDLQRELQELVNRRQE
jgi:hypothetical protein